MHTFMDDVQWFLRDVSPFAMACTILALVAFAFYFFTKWKEFMMIGLTAGLYVIPFLLTWRH